MKKQTKYENNTKDWNCASCAASNGQICRPFCGFYETKSTYGLNKHKNKNHLLTPFIAFTIRSMRSFPGLFSPSKILLSKSNLLRRCSNSKMAIDADASAVFPK